MYATTDENFKSNQRRKQELKLSKHSAVRTQQRAISQEAVELIVFFGERSHDGRNGIRCLMTDKAVAKLEKVVGHTQRTDNLRGCYVVLSAKDEHTVITVGHRHV